MISTATRFTPSLPILNRAMAGALVDCANCDCTSGVSRAVLGRGPADAVLVVVGEAPGFHEMAGGKPFMGRSGDLLWNVLMRALPLARQRTYTTNALLCTPEKGTTDKSIKACNTRLAKELELLTEKKVILCVGAKAATAIRGEKSSMAILSGVVEWSERWGCWVAYAYHPAAVLRNPDLYHDLVWGIRRALAALKPDYDPKPVDIPHFLVETPVGAVDALFRLSLATTIICDLETDGLDPRRDPILEIGFKIRGEQPIILTRDAFTTFDTFDIPGKLRTLFKMPGITWIGHNFKFDCAFLRYHFGVSPRIGADTMLMSHCLDERSGGEGGGFHDLKRLARKWCDAPEWEGEIDKYKKELKNKFRMSLVPDELRRKYHAYDLEYTYRLYEALTMALRKEPASPHKYPMPLVTHKVLLVPAANALVDIEQRGIRIDVDRLAVLREEYILLAEAERTKAIFLAHRDSGFNPNSTDQVKDVLYTPQEDGGMGYPDMGSTAKDVIKELQRIDAAEGKEPNPFLDSVLTYRSLLHTRSTYIDGIASRLGSDGRIRTNLLLHGTTSGRLSSRNPNLQNLPADSVIKELFIPSAGRVMINADYKQLEVRVLAWYSRDPKLCAALKASDFHWEVCKASFPFIVGQMDAAIGDLRILEHIAKRSDLFTDVARRQERTNERTEDPKVLYGWMKTRLRLQAKKITFGVMYGEGAEALSQHGRGIGCAVETAAEFIANWKAGYRKATAVLNGWAQDAANYRWVESASGRRRRFPPGSIIGTSPNEAMNHPIQSLASDICLMALTRLNDRLPTEGLGDVLLSVHDSILAEVHAERVDAAVAAIQEEMRNVMTCDEVLFDVDAAVGSSWGACK